MANQIPQYSDITLEFDNLGYNLVGTTLDLNTVDDITLAISYGHPTNAPILNLKKSVNSGNFTINSATSVSVTLNATQVGNTVGRYFVNLWITIGGRHVTHLPQDFDIEPAINFS